MEKKLGLSVRIVAKPGKEEAVSDFLKSALPLAMSELETASWYAIQINNNTFGVFDTFPHEEGRKAHLEGRIAKALMANAADLLSVAPDIQPITILASK